VKMFLVFLVTLISNLFKPTETIGRTLLPTKVSWPKPRKQFAIVRTLNTVRKNRLGNSRTNIVGFVCEYIVLVAYFSGNATIAINLPTDKDWGLLFTHS
jgi:hypothetical protein